MSEAHFMDLRMHCDTPPKRSCLPRMRIVTDIAAYFGVFVLF